MPDVLDFIMYEQFGWETISKEYDGEVSDSSS